jgi:hypothetical protein
MFDKKLMESCKSYLETLDPYSRYRKKALQEICNSMKENRYCFPQDIEEIEEIVLWLLDFQKRSSNALDKSDNFEQMVLKTLWEGMKKNTKEFYEFTQKRFGEYKAISILFDGEIAAGNDGEKVLFFLNNLTEAALKTEKDEQKVAQDLGWILEMRLDLTTEQQNQIIESIFKIVQNFKNNSNKAPTMNKLHFAFEENEALKAIFSQEQENIRKWQEEFRKERDQKIFG